MSNDDDFDFMDEHTVVGEHLHVLKSSSRNAAYVIVIAGPNVGEMHRLAPGTTSIGRAKGAKIQLADTEISRLHVNIVNRGETVVVQDNDSTNGTFVNGHQVKSHALQDGDKIQVGTTTILKFSYHDDLEEAFQRKMYESALRDGLTGAFNKKYFTERLTGEIAYAMRHGTPMSLVLFDLDHFKRVNDSYGHLAGDYTLATFAERTSGMIRREDVFARYGGEEFAVISRGLDGSAGFAFAERIRKMVCQYEFVYEGHAIPLTVSVGVAAMPDVAAESCEDLVSAADQALYSAKHGGRDRTVRYGA